MQDCCENFRKKKRRKKKKKEAFSELDRLAASCC
jgi:hypothetical protein